jgi:hypothetical protein
MATSITWQEPERRDQVGLRWLAFTYLAAIAAMIIVTGLGGAAERLFSDAEQLQREGDRLLASRDLPALRRNGDELESVVGKLRHVRNLIWVTAAGSLLVLFAMIRATWLLTSRVPDTLRWLARAAALGVPVLLMTRVLSMGANWSDSPLQCIGVILALTHERATLRIARVAGESELLESIHRWYRGLYGLVVAAIIGVVLLVVQKAPETMFLIFKLILIAGIVIIGSMLAMQILKLSSRIDPS